MSFDAPDRYYCVVDRQSTATPLQSLILMNDPQFLEASRVLGARMMSSDIEDPITFAFLSLIGRSPRDSEYNLLNMQLNEVLEEFTNDPNKATPWLSAGEYPIDPEINKTALAAHTMVASTIMNFEEFVNKR